MFAFWPLAGFYLVAPSFPGFPFLSPSWDSLVAQMVKNLPAMRETQVRCPDREDPLEKEMAAHSSTLA